MSYTKTSTRRAAAKRHSILEAHYKTILVLASFFITITGWWAWNLFLSGVYTPSPSPYDVRGGFISGFGHDIVWWLTLLMILSGLAVSEMCYKAMKRNLIVRGLWNYRRQWKGWAQLVWNGRSTNGHQDGRVAGEPVEEWHLELWQEMEQDPIMKERIQEMRKAEDDDVNVAAAGIQETGKAS